MPNWCHNILMVTGPAADVTRFREHAKSTDIDLSLGRFCPVPENEPNGGYYWCIEHWGCKWDVQGILETEWEDYLEYEFDSPWSPPVPWLKPVSEMFPTLEFRLKYDEPGVGFMGVARAKEGIVDDDSLSYA